MNQSDAPQSATWREVGGNEALAREQSMKQLRHWRLLAARPSVLDPFRLDAMEAEGELAPRFHRHEYTYADGARAPGRTLPVQGVVTRTDRFHAPTTDIEIVDGNGNVVEILRFPIAGRYGPDVNDPSGRLALRNPRTAICAVLAPYAAARCLMT